MKPTGSDIASQPLQDIFGQYTGYVAAAVLIVIAVLIVWAFQRGQSIELGPIKIGRGRRSRALPRTETVADQHMLPPGSRPEDLARVFDVNDAAQFYSAIAVNYDQGNSVNLLTTHMEVITEISRAHETRPGLRVLDLGGGTGHAVATHFFNDSSIRWTYVDISPAMAGRLQQHLAGRPFYENLQVHVEDINQVHRLLRGKHYDVVLLNLVLSSMPQPPDLARIAELMQPDGLLIVSDINPQYTQAHPYYKGTTAEGTKVALRTRAVQPLDVLTRAEDAGLRLAEMKKVSDAAVSYSFIAVFANTVRPGGSPATGAAHSGDIPHAV
jgi:2-polyprenyl-3-methyl-5-hydroxy-6-metoxy-1,4-benzoquinol methylase